MAESSSSSNNNNNNNNSSEPLGISDQVQSNYYPPGWNRERLIAASKDDIFTIPPEEFEKLRQGMMSAMGDAGFQAFVQDLLAKETATIPKVTVRPNFLNAINHQYQGQEWGFIIYRATSYDNDAQWQQFRQKWDELIALELDDYSDIPGVEEARQWLTWRWVERPEFENAGLEQIARHYTSLSLTSTSETHIPPGLDHSLCLVITKESFNSILTATTSTRNLKTSDKIQPAPPFIVAVSKYIKQLNDDAAEAEDEDVGDVRPPFVSFKHSIWTLLDALFGSIGNQAIDPWEMNFQWLGEGAIWLSSMMVYKNGRYQKAGGRGRGRFLDLSE